MIKGRPFVKWAGGKRQIIDKLKKYVPDLLEGEHYYLNYLQKMQLLMTQIKNL